MTIDINDQNINSGVVLKVMGVSLKYPPFSLMFFITSHPPRLWPFSPGSQRIPPLSRDLAPEVPGPEMGEWWGDLQWDMNDLLRVNDHIPEIYIVISLILMSNIVIYSLILLIIVYISEIFISLMIHYGITIQRHYNIHELFHGILITNYSNYMILYNYYIMG